MTASERIREARSNETRKCYGCVRETPARRYRVVDSRMNIIWDGGCSACAHKIAAQNPGWHVR